MAKSAQTIILSLFIVSLLLNGLHTQTVDCLKNIQSSYAYPTSCLSTSSDTRPINATAYVKAAKNTTWYGPIDWTPYIARDGYLVYDLY